MITSSPAHRLVPAPDLLTDHGANGRVGGGNLAPDDIGDYLLARRPLSLGFRKSMKTWQR
jgi:hypothetical protein